MKITLKELKKQSGLIEQWIVESVDLSLYIAHARINGEERVIAEDEKKILKRRPGIFVLTPKLKGQLPGYLRSHKNSGRNT